MDVEEPDDFEQPEPLAPPKPQTVPTVSLKPNPHNPRVLFDEEPLLTLEASIRKVGVLVPLTVYRATGSKLFTILDGQRRWICASRIGLADVPINEVGEPSLAQNIVTMFQIHKLRKDWELMPTALKLGVLIKELDENRDSALADLTGLDPAVVTRCKKLLSFENDYQDLMLEPDPNRRLNADLFIEIHPIVNDRSVRSADWYDRRTVINSLVHKYLHKLSGFKAVTDFRKIKAYLTAARKSDNIDELLNRFKEFINSDSLSISDLEVEAARIHRAAETMVRSLMRIGDEIKALESEDFIAEEDLWVQLEALLGIIREKLFEGERRAT